MTMRLRILRERLSGVVGEVGQSVRTLRTSVGENESLGTAIGSLAVTSVAARASRSR